MKFAIVMAALALVLVALIVANAPPPDGALPAGGSSRIPIAAVFAMLEAENDAVRELWTKRIVGAGKNSGLRFDKHWHDPDMDAGPLPALFLRATAESLRQSHLPLYLFLGSDFPINPVNKFTGLQSDRFEEIARTGEPQFFFDDDIRFHTAMFSDIGVAQACIDCHNAEPESAKKDWRLGDIMGATTWSYPKSEVSLAEALAMLNALRQAFRHAYEQYVAKASAFADPPPLGEKWPEDGYFLPSANVFVEEAQRRASPGTLQALFEFRRAGP